MEKNVETHLKRAILDKGLVLRFEAIVDYPNDPLRATDAEIEQNPGKYHFKKIKFKAVEKVPDPRTKKYVNKASSSDEDVKAINDAEVGWNRGSLTPLTPKPKILSTTDAQELINVDIRRADAERIVNFNRAARGTFTVTGSGKKEQLAEAIKHWEMNNGINKRKISIVWVASRVLWS
jgi:hypothetical protein